MNSTYILIITLLIADNVNCNSFDRYESKFSKSDKFNYNKCNTGEEYIYRNIAFCGKIKNYPEKKVTKIINMSMALKTYGKWYFGNMFQTRVEQPDRHYSKHQRCCTPRPIAITPQGFKLTRYKSNNYTLLVNTRKYQQQITVGECAGLCEDCETKLNHIQTLDKFKCKQEWTVIRALEYVNNSIKFTDIQLLSGCILEYST